MRALTFATLTSLGLTLALGIHAATPEAASQDKPAATAASATPVTTPATTPDEAPVADAKPVEDPEPVKEVAPQTAPAPTPQPVEVGAPAAEDKPAAKPQAAAKTETSPAPSWQSISDEDAMAIASAYLADLGSLRADFQQISPDGMISTGTAYLKKPGRARFDYDAPSPITIVADGFWVALLDDETGTQDRYPLSATPLAILLDKGTDLNRLATLELLEQGEDLLRLHLKSREEPGLGTLILTFSRAPMALTQWAVVDAQGYKTRVLLSALEPGAVLNPALFHIDVMDPSRRR